MEEVCEWLDRDGTSKVQIVMMIDGDGRDRVIDGDGR